MRLKGVLRIIEGKKDTKPWQEIKGKYIESQTSRWFHDSSTYHQAFILYKGSRPMQCMSRGANTMPREISKRAEGHVYVP